MKQIFCSSALQRGCMILAVCAATGFDPVSSLAAGNPKSADPAVSKAIMFIGDLYRNGSISGTDGDAALDYYAGLSGGEGRIIGAIPPAQLIETARDNPEPDAGNAVRTYQLASNLGNPDAFLRLGDLYLDGDLITADPEKAFAFFQQAAALGSETASVNVGMMMIDGTGTPHDISGGIALLNEAADKGNGSALMALGELYRNGQPEAVEADAGRSFTYYKRAADGGNIAASIITARMMIDGEGTPRAPGKGYEIARTLSEARDPSALLLMGDIQLSGIPDLLPPDAAKAFEAYSQASAAGSSTGRRQTALMLLYGQGVEQNIEAGLGILQDMADAGNASALYELGQLYENGAEGAITADLPKAFEYYKSAAAEDPGSALRMAFMLIEGNGTRRDPEAGVVALQKLAGAGDPGADLMLGEYYYGAIGKDQEQDLGKAFFHYRSAAKTGSGTARVQTALMLLRGEGTPTDQKAGMDLLNAAAEAGDPNALLTLGKVYVSGEAGKVDANAAISAYEAAASQGISIAYILLGDLYSRGEVIPADGDRAVFYYKKAAGIEPPPDLVPADNAGTQ